MLNEDMVSFKDLDVDEIERLCAKIIEDHTQVEVFHEASDSWVELPFKKIDFDLIYRWKPRKPFINWSHVKDGFNYLAIDSSCEAYIYKEMPIVNDEFECWVNQDDCYSEADPIRAYYFDSFDIGACDWKDSLIVRP
jgi:hypothetical protein